jgi:hypothetical protein
MKQTNKAEETSKALTSDKAFDLKYDIKKDTVYFNGEPIPRLLTHLLNAIEKKATVGSNVYKGFFDNQQAEDLYAKFSNPKTGNLTRCQSN